MSGRRVRRPGGALVWRRLEVDFATRQRIAVTAVASAWVSMAVCLGLAVAAWSDVLVWLAAVPALAAAVVSVAAMPGASLADPAPETVAVLTAPAGLPLGVWHRVETRIENGAVVEQTITPLEERTA